MVPACYCVWEFTHMQACMEDIVWHLVSSVLSTLFTYLLICLVIDWLFACMRTTVFPCEPSCYLSLTYILRQDLSLTLELTKSACREHLLSCLYLSSCVKLFMQIPLYHTICVGTGISTQIIMPEWQAFYRLSHLPSPENMFYSE